MGALFEKLLRGNFRCGRMRHSRTTSMAGQLFTPPGRF